MLVLENHGFMSKKHIYMSKKHIYMSKKVHGFHVKTIYLPSFCIRYPANILAALSTLAAQGRFL